MLFRSTAAVEEAVFLTRFVNKVTIIHRRDQLRADASAQKKAKANPKIDFLWDSVVTEVVGKDFVEALNVRNVKNGEERRIPFDGVFVFIGHKPISELYEGKLSLKKRTDPDRRAHADGDSGRLRRRGNRRRRLSSADRVGRFRGAGCNDAD